MCYTESGKVNNKHVYVLTRITQCYIRSGDKHMLYGSTGQVDTSTYIYIYILCYIVLHRVRLGIHVYACNMLDNVT